MMIAGWCAIATAVLTVMGLATLLTFFGTGSPRLGALNDLNTVAAALVTVPVALSLHPAAARVSPVLAAVAVGIDLVGVPLAAGFSAPLNAAGTHRSWPEPTVTTVLSRTPPETRGDFGMRYQPCVPIGQTELRMVSG